jgi:Single-strand binding protein family
VLAPDPLNYRSRSSPINNFSPLAAALQDFLFRLRFYPHSAAKFLSSIPALHSIPGLFEDLRPKTLATREKKCVNFQIWGKPAENFGNLVKKGQEIFVDGKLRMDEWTDKQTNTRPIPWNLLAREDDSSAKRKYQHTASIRESGRCRPDLCEEPVDQTSRDPKLVSHRNHKCLRRGQLNKNHL